jgi:hypothetical protein
VAEAKVTDSEMASHLSFVAGMGHPCGVEFHAQDHLKAHPEYAWQAPLLQDLKKNPWTVIQAAPEVGSVPRKTGSVSAAGTR